MSSLKVLPTVKPDRATTEVDTKTEARPTPTYWRSFAELEARPEFQEFVEREFAAPLENEPPSSPLRRRFMQLMGASFVLAGCRWEKDYVVPHTRRPEGYVPGEARTYATAMELDGVSVGLLATSYDGRPIKLEGNPEHPSSLGAANAYHQAAVLGLYDPDRSRGAARYQNGTRAAAEWPALMDALQGVLKSGAQVRVLATSSTSPTRARLQKALLAKFPQLRWVEYDAVSRDSVAQGAKLAFGKGVRTVLAPENAKVLVALDADFLASEPGSLAYARRFAAGRKPEAGEMNRLYAVESNFSPTGTLADHRLPLRSSQIKAFVAALDAELTARTKPLPELGAAQPKPSAAFLSEPRVKAMFDAIVEDLAANVGKSLVVAGSQQPAEVHALVHRLNAMLGNVGRTVRYLESADAERPTHVAAIGALAKELAAGTVKGLLILGGNPVYDAPADLDFGSAMAKVEFSLHLAQHEDETSRATSWHAPGTHFLEQWSDGIAHDGTVTIAQPLIAPLFDGRSELELLAALVGEEADGQKLVRATHPTLGEDKAWRRAVHDGFIAASAPAHGEPKLQPLAPLTFAEHELAGTVLGNGKLEVTFHPCGKVYDGRFSNNGWLQELPESLTKVTWDNAVLLSPKTAKELGITDSHLVTLTLGGKSITLPAIHAPGIAEGTLRLALGYGRKVSGMIAGLVSEGVAPVGVSVEPLRTSAGFAIATGAQLADTGTWYRLAVTQDLHAIDQLGREIADSRTPTIIREATLAQFKEEPEFAKHAVHSPPLLNLWQDPVAYNGHKWGMAIDLSKCMGCNACVTACQAENNTPVVGKERVQMGREMHWIRVDRYYKGDPVDPEVTFQPMVCQQCENAPCEQVCPVGATMHSHEGLNDMAYNRCIGTRYCANNCPYKVRRFNFFNYHLDVIENPKNASKKLVFNPEVTIRARGVMEKCTFCVQRIQNVKIKAKNAAVQKGTGVREIADGTIKTACQQTCPTGAIVFGDLNDSQSAVAAQHERPLAYALLGELNNRPRNHYIARIRNPNAKLAQKVAYPITKPHGAGHGAAHEQHGAGKPAHGNQHGQAPSGHEPKPHGEHGAHEEKH